MDWGLFHHGDMGMSKVIRRFMNHGTLVYPVITLCLEKFVL